MRREFLQSADDRALSNAEQTNAVSRLACAEQGAVANGVKKALAMFSNKQFIKHRGGWALIQPPIGKRQSTPRRQRKSWRVDAGELRR